MSDDRKTLIFRCILAAVVLGLFFEFELRPRYPYFSLFPMKCEVRVGQVWVDEYTDSPYWHSVTNHVVSVRNTWSRGTLVKYRLGDTDMVLETPASVFVLGMKQR